MRDTSSTPWLVSLAAVSISAFALVGCSGAPDEPTDSDDDTEESVVADEEAEGGSTVSQAAASSCSTTSVKGLSLQIIAEGRCINPNAYAKIPSKSNLKLGSAVFPYLEAPARDRLASALSAKPGWTMTLNSALRTVAQQYLLYRWYSNGHQCGIKLAATPGNSNHETGIALDVSQYSTWRSVLGGKGFAWFGNADPVHFDYKGSGSVNYKGLDVKAFQRLWNRNHPSDKISVDGSWGPQTEARMKKSPAGGFAKGAICASAKAEEVAACGHSPFEGGAPMKAECSSCVANVCAEIPECCERAWDESCLDLAEERCGASIDPAVTSVELDPAAEYEIVEMGEPEESE